MDFLSSFAVHNYEYPGQSRLWVFTYIYGIPLLNFVDWFVLMVLAPLAWIGIARRTAGGDGRKLLMALIALLPLCLAAIVLFPGSQRDHRRGGAAMKASNCPIHAFGQKYPISCVVFFLNLRVCDLTLFDISASQRLYSLIPPVKA